MKLLIKAYKRLILELPENLRVLKTIRNLDQLKPNDEKGLSVIIFSKDRPLQLEALINSYFHFVEGATSPIVIYNAKNPEFKEAYKCLFKSMNSKIQSFHEDKVGFKKVLLGVLNNIKTKRMIFLVDDIIFKNHIQLNEVEKYDDKTIPCLRLAPHLSKNYTQGKTQEVPKLLQDGSSYFWSFASGKLDWAYPLSVDGNVFFTQEIIEMTKVLDFKAPNSYEAKLQKFNPVFKNRRGVCFKESIVLNIPCNKVQNENDNISGEVDPESLLEVFYKKAMDYKSYEGFINESCHQELPLRFYNRTIPLEKNT